MIVPASLERSGAGYIHIHAETHKKESYLHEDAVEGGKLLLSDHSLLEKCVKKKREELERLHSEPLDVSDRLVDSHESTPSRSSASELMRACSARVLEPAREVPYITAPSRSRLGSVEVEPAVLKQTQKASISGNNKMMELLASGERMLSASYHGLKLSPISNRSQRSKSVTKPTTFEFDAPMSPFEQRLQNQALQLRKISALSENDVSDEQLVIKERRRMKEATREGNEGNVGEGKEGRIDEVCMGRYLIRMSGGKACFFRQSLNKHKVVLNERRSQSS
ncbi:unnamed protein product [Gongylonema pulchrum]|uniref:Uncharacterized protein n=1 Tax=Gongylonema pulchrum TaxID=637853 RepID=A0A183CXE5_9BILA|nr:unnamed protein product [Gongylonema pulchrum]